MNLYKRGNIYQVDFVDANGERQRQSTRRRDHRTARDEANQIVRAWNEALPGAKGSKASKPTGVTVAHILDRTMSEVWSKSRSPATARSNVRALKRYVGDTPLTTLNYDTLSKAAQAMEKDGSAPATVKRKLQALGKALTMATKWTGSDGKPLLPAKPPMPQITVRNFKERVISPEEEAAIFAALEARREREPMRDWRRFAAFITFLRDTGCRVGEAVGVSEDHITVRDTEANGSVHFVEFPRYTTKSEKPRILPLSDAIVGSLEFLRGNAVGGKIFPYRETTAWYTWNVIRADLKAAGVNMDDVVLHTWRHTCLTRLARKGVRIERIADWAGHSTLQVTMDRYRHMLVEDKLDTLAALTT